MFTKIIEFLKANVDYISGGLLLVTGVIAYFTMSQEMILIFIMISIITLLLIINKFSRR